MKKLSSLLTFGFILFLSGYALVAAANTAVEANTKKSEMRLENQVQRILSKTQNLDRYKMKKAQINRPIY